MRHYAEVSLVVKDRIVSTHERVTKYEVVIAIADDGQGAQAQIFVGRCVENVIKRV